MIRGIETFGPKANPDVVVLAIYTDDLRRAHPYFAGSGYRIPKFELSNGELMTRPFSHPLGWRRWRFAQMFFQATVHRDLEFFELNRAILMRFLALSREQDFEPIALFLPGKDNTPRDLKRRGFLRQWASQNGVPFLDFTAAIHGAGIRKVFIRNNWHWNLEGHRIAAVELERFLASHVALLRDAPMPTEYAIGQPPPASVDNCPDFQVEAPKANQQRAPKQKRAQRKRPRSEDGLGAAAQKS